MSDFMALCSSKTRGREDDSSSSLTAETKRLRRRREDDSSSKLWSLEDLNDGVLIEILTRLPTAKSATASKIVCRRWCSLISNSYFITKFLNHHINQKSSYDPYYPAYQNPPTIFISTDKNPQFFLTPHADLKTHDHESPPPPPPPPPPVGYTLEFLPEERKSVDVLASSDDLLFCRAEGKDSINFNYYICNPLTMQWLLLPPPPPVRRFGRQCYGLVCAPNHHQRWQQQQQAPYDFRFRAVCIACHEETQHSYFDVYCSETRQWNESVVLVGRQCQPWNRTNVVAHEGRLYYWIHGLNSVAAYDPFNDDAQTIVMKEDDGIECRYKFISLCVGVCQGSLRFMRLVCYINRDVAADHLGVWELEDYESKTLSLKHKIYFNRVQNSLVQRFIKRGDRFNMLNAVAIGLHPNDKDVVYISFAKIIIACRIQGELLQVVDKILYGSGFCKQEKVFTTALPWWPTPI